MQTKNSKGSKTNVIYFIHFFGSYTNIWRITWAWSELRPRLGYCGLETFSIHFHDWWCIYVIYFSFSFVNVVETPPMKKHQEMIDSSALHLKELICIWANRNFQSCCHQLASSFGDALKRGAPRFRPRYAGIRRRHPLSMPFKFQSLRLYPTTIMSIFLFSDIFSLATV